MVLCTASKHPLNTHNTQSVTTWSSRCSMAQVVMWEVRELSAVELSYSLLRECTSTTMWGRLGRWGQEGLAP